MIRREIMEEYVCHYATGPMDAARRVYHADTLPAAMAAHNATMPEYANTVLKWVGPTGIVFQMHDSKMLPAGEENYGTIWVCQCCMLAHANGECCADDTHGGDSIEPLSSIESGYHVAMGMAYEDHAEDCLFAIKGSSARYAGHECDCDRNTYSTSQCEGCGSYLHGERHAMTLFGPPSN